MKTICAVCPSCGEVELPPADVTLTVCDPGDRSSYVFRCPRCADEVRKPANAHVITLLVHADCPTIVLELPAEALEPHSGPALTTDDLLDLKLELAQL